MPSMSEHCRYRLGAERDGESRLRRREFTLRGEAVAIRGYSSSSAINQSDSSSAMSRMILA